MNVIDRIIKDLNKKEKEEAEERAREEFMANQQSQASNLKQNNAPKQFQINTDDSWYFYNTAAKNSGRTEFQRRWGSRKLEDNWRRRNKSAFNVADFGATTSDDEVDNENTTDGADDESISEEEKAKIAHADDPHYPEYYLKQIPFTEEQKTVARDVIQEGLYNMGLILKDKMDDPAAAAHEFDRLLTEFPDNVYRLDVYYNLYLMYVREGRMDLAEHYRGLILRDFADSKYGIALSNPDYIESLRNMDKEQNSLYEDAYQAYMDNDNATVHKVYADVSERYPMTKLMPKFMFLEALAYVTERKPDDFNSTLRTLLERYPDTDLTPTVSAWLKGMAQGRKLQTGTGTNMRGMLWNTRLSNDSTLAETDSIAFTLNPEDKQLLVFVFPTDQVSSNELLFNIARHNFRSFVVKDFDLEQMNFGQLGMIVVKDFDNLNELNHYRRVMAQSSDFKLPAGVRPIVISQPNFEALLNSGGSLDDYFEFLERQNYQDAQADILPYTEIETLKEADERAAALTPDDIIIEEPAKPAAKETKQPVKTPEPPKKETEKKTTKPVKQEYDPGSEGDDPLLD